MKLKLNNPQIQLEKKTEMEFDEIEEILLKKDQILFLIFIKCLLLY